MKLNIKDEKPVYMLKISDFIPAVGIVSHNKRCLEEMSKNTLAGSSEYFAAECFARDFVLTIYNAAVFGGFGGAIYGLTQLISK